MNSLKDIPSLTAGKARKIASKSSSLAMAKYLIGKSQTSTAILSKKFGYSSSHTSQKLRVMVDNNIISSSKYGNKYSYFVTPAQVVAIKLKVEKTNKKKTTKPKSSKERKLINDMVFGIIWLV